jgi:hypothetical protein
MFKLSTDLNQMFWGFNSLFLFNCKNEIGAILLPTISKDSMYSTFRGPDGFYLQFVWLWDCQLR